MKMTLKVGLLTMIWFVLAVSLPAQPEPQPDDDRAQDRLLQMLFPPDLIMRHQRELGLTGEQRRRILDVLRDAQTSFTEHQWDLQKELDALASMVGAGNHPESELIAQLDRILELEREVKRARFLLALRVRQQLTPEQIAKLQELRPLNRRLREGGPILPRRPQRP
jgi:Spy/CpxP family protein refolding chaperone